MSFPEPRDSASGRSDGPKSRPTPPPQAPNIFSYFLNRRPGSGPMMPSLAGTQVVHRVAEFIASNVEQRPTEPVPSFQRDLGTGYVQEELKKDVTRHEAMMMEEDDENFIDPEMDFAVAKNSGEIFDRLGCNEIQFNEIEKKLPVHSVKQRIVDTICRNSVTIIEGATGCGKSTQVPQFILDHCMREQVVSILSFQRDHCNIICTQPRRIAAVTLTDYVCRTRGPGYSMGGLIGYQIALDRGHKSEDTLLLYVTTGILLRVLCSKARLDDFSHIVIDEVHERDRDTDFVLLCVRMLLVKSPQVKVIIMSATMESNIFHRYFSQGNFSCEVIAIPKSESGYIVNEYYLDKLQGLSTVEHPSFEKSFTLPILTPDIVRISEDEYKLVPRLLIAFEKFERGEHQGRSPEHWATVLVFLPGEKEIRDLQRILSSQSFASSHWNIIPIHSLIPKSQQQLAFRNPERSCRKVILSTNICESSVTISDARFVIDFCRTRNLNWDPDTNFETLQLEWASRANLAQRRGRVGRTRSGRVYHLVPEYFVREHFQAYATPELLRCPPHKVILSMKLLNLGSPRRLFAHSLDPPPLQDIQKAVLELKEIGALSRVGEDPEDGELTFVGRILESLSVDIHLGKLIILGYCFDVLEDAVIMAACLSSRSLFLRPFNDEIRSFMYKLMWSWGSSSDCLAYKNAFKSYIRLCHDETTTERQKVDYTRKYFLDHVVLEEVRKNYDDIVQRLKRNYEITAHWKPAVNFERSETEVLDNEFLLKIVIAGAFYPNFFALGRLNAEQVYKQVEPHNPLQTVYLKDLPSGVGYLYERSILERLNNIPPTNVQKKIHYHHQKACVVYSQEFWSEVVTDAKVGKVPTSLIMAVKFGKINKGIPIQAHDPKEIESTLQRAPASAELDMQIASNRKKKPFELRPVQTPPFHPEVNQMEVFVHCFLDINHVACTLTNQQPQINQLQALLNSQEITSVLKPISIKKLPAIGEYIIAYFVEDGANVQDSQVFRAQVLRLDLEKRNVLVHYCDYANQKFIPFGHCYQFGPQLQNHPVIGLTPQMGMILTLTVEPNPVRKSVKWNNQAMDVLTSKFLKSYFYGIFTIYSIVDDEIRGDLMMNIREFDDQGLASQRRTLSVNKYLVDEKYAVEAQEGEHSKQSNIQCRAIRGIEESILPKEVDPRFSEEAVRNASKHLPTKTKYVRGPYSPLDASVYPLVKGCQGVQTFIAGDSVNSVLIYDDFEAPHTRFMVSAHARVGGGTVQKVPGPRGDGDTKLQTTSKVINVYHSTLLPSVPGIGPLVAMLFCPRAELRMDRRMDTYVGVICGLGHDRRKHSLYPVHDMELPFDFEFELEDLNFINQIREKLNDLLCVIPGRDLPENSGPVVRKTQNELRTMTKALFEKPRKYTSTREKHCSDYAWGKLPPNRRMTHIPRTVHVPELVFPYIDGVVKSDNVGLYEQLQGMGLAMREG
ncbi:unnamed protein product [Cyprideis torosa]|uniref:Probable ATP-dependent RNA helicase spindle-E n=1 Tax=Cyprideis torosa TaxID=163714 RepID=A0A7R8ZLP5_9CRUS|nr:unnamed protein product [Cyprideis torosa]CAG0893716.1 unnamed protein product [Cyprideis torosa]